MESARELEADEYLREHRVMELLNNLTALLLYHRPEKPREFLINQLEKLKFARSTDVEYPSLFDESNLDAVFGILDPSGKGHITGKQYLAALKTLGADESNIQDPPEKVTLEVFKHDVAAALLDMSHYVYLSRSYIFGGRLLNGKLELYHSGKYHGILSLRCDSVKLTALMEVVFVKINHEGVSNGELNACFRLKINAGEFSGISG